VFKLARVLKLTNLGAIETEGFPMSIYRDRRDAGRALATALSKHRGEPRQLVLALPRGGVPVGYEVARALEAPLDVFVVRKLGVPGHDEFAMGALASGGARVLSQDVISALKISEESIAAILAREQRELNRREQLYRGKLPPLDVRTKTVILVDDGLATGSTMRAAIAGLKQLAAQRIVVAVPIAAPETCQELSREVDEMVCAATPQPFHAVGVWYEDFSQTTDHEVRQLLEDGQGRPAEQHTRSA
jgi:putative phosphoribosyl transferase